LVNVGPATAFKITVDFHEPLLGAGGDVDVAGFQIFRRLPLLRAGKEIRVFVDLAKFTIVGFCSDCHHDAPVPRINEDVEIPTLIKKLLCSRCGSGDCSIRIIYTGAGGFEYARS
jgi:hypothetical protein